MKPEDGVKTKIKNICENLSKVTSKIDAHNKFIQSFISTNKGMWHYSYILSIGCDKNVIGTNTFNNAFI